MKKSLAAAAVLAAVLVPSGTANAETIIHANPGDVGNGKAWGNCQNSASGGLKDPYAGGAGQGMGGHVDQRDGCGKSSGELFLGPMV